MTTATDPQASAPEPPVPDVEAALAELLNARKAIASMDRGSQNRGLQAALQAIRRAEEALTGSRQ